MKPNITNLFPNHHMVFMLKLNQSDLYHQYLDETWGAYDKAAVFDDLGWERVGLLAARSDIKQPADYIVW